MLVKYSHNNSGGYWWLEDEDWYKLEKVGWKIDWYKDRESDFGYKDGRFLGALASGAEKEFPTLKDAIIEFEKITGQRASDGGCNCCGPPHNFSAKDGDGRVYASGENCLAYIYDDIEVPQTLREAVETIQASKRGSK